MSNDRKPPRGAGSEPVALHPGIEARETARRAELERWARRRMRALRAFFTHLTLYVIVNFALLVADVFTGGDPWFFYPLLGWGLGLGLHAAQAYELLPWFTQKWEERKVLELMEEQERRR